MTHRWSQKNNGLLKAVLLVSNVVSQSFKHPIHQAFAGLFSIFPNRVLPDKKPYLGMVYGLFIRKIINNIEESREELAY
jgi:hypothetical protein